MGMLLGETISIDCQVGSISDRTGLEHKDRVGASACSTLRRESRRRDGNAATRDTSASNVLSAASATEESLSTKLGSVLSHAPLVGERLGDDKGTLLRETMSIDCPVGDSSDRIGLELIPALGPQLGPPLGKTLRRSTFSRGRAHSLSRCFRMLHSSVLSHAPLVGERLGDEMGTLLGETLTPIIGE
jgi:hypothetical protein